MAEPCPHLLDPASCADCLAARARGLYRVPPGMPLPPVTAAGLDWQQLWEDSAAAGDAGLGPWTQARYRGHCRGCGGPWSPGDLIRASDEEDGWLCRECGADRPP